MIDGYQKQWDFLKKSVELGRIPHAIMFCGPEDSQAKVLAIDFAKFVNCSSSINSKKPCSHCKNCKEIEQGIHPDFLLLGPKDSGEIEISQIRDLIWRLSLKTISCPFKIAIIEKAHLMNQESQNCLLKILEEPKGKTLLILITYYPGMLLPTITSRVQKIRFFSEKKEKIKDYEKLISDFLKLLKSDLSFRFKYVKDLPDKEIAKIINLWILFLRTVLIEKLGGQEFEKRNDFKDYSPIRIAKILSFFQNTHYLLSTTNINPKLALETLLINI